MHFSKKNYSGDAYSKLESKISAKYATLCSLGEHSWYNIFRNCARHGFGTYGRSYNFSAMLI